MDSMIDKIRAAEQQAEDIRAQGLTDARDMGARAREEAAERLAKAAEDERQKTRDALAKAEEDGKALSAQVLSAAREVVAREEAAAQKQAEEEAARKAREQAAARQEEDLRLTRLAEAAAQKFNAKAIDAEAAAAADAVVSDIYMGRTEAPAAADAEEDLEAELRRLIFSDLDKK